MQYQNMIMRGSINHRIVINPNFNWGNIDFINQKLQDAHDNGKLASKNVEGLAVHEMGHFLTYLDCDDEKKLFQREKDISACYVEGVSLYSDTSRDGAECLTEAFVRYYNKENIPERLMQLVERYILRWRKS